ncbi:selenocysteine lyase [Elysia marginata]|uniref:Selenocysteine lyase n=1 Tax=Elysia marginata TaxID=1093978 RepID=A0AAV4HCC2_9GAST|nr:selenocysteine lyase [Elysia marginata]
MSSRSAQYRRSLKETNPEKYSEYKQRNAERSREQRQRKKRKWEEETQTRAMVKEREKVKEQNRIRVRRFLEKKRGGCQETRKSSKSSPTAKIIPHKRPVDMSPDERRAYNAEQRRAQRAALSHQKKAALKKKNRERMQLKRQKEKKTVRRKLPLALSILQKAKLPKRISNSASRKRPMDMSPDERRTSKPRRATKIISLKSPMDISPDKGQASQSSPTSEIIYQKRPMDMSPDERRAYNAEQRKAQRAALSHQKKAALKKKNRERMQLKREKEQEAKQKNLPMALNILQKAKLPKRVSNSASRAKQSSKMVYLDYNATTPLAPDVIDAITESLKEAWGNPSSSYTAGLKAKKVISEARQHVANMVGASENDIFFTSGGTESNNWVLQMALQLFDWYDPAGEMPVSNACKSESRRVPHFITSNVEHDSVKLVLDHLKKTNIADVTYVPVSHSTGAVDVDEVMAAITPNTVMITVMLANNETGVLQPVKEICRKVRDLKRHEGETKRIYLHTDAAQAIGKIGVDVKDLGVDYLTIVGHKFYGPRIGAMCAVNPLKDTPVLPVLFGGGQERNFRPGTENTPMIAGLGKAAELVCKNVNTYQAHMADVRNYLEAQLEEKFGEGICINGKFPTSDRLPNTCNVSFIDQKLKGGEILSKAPSVQASVGAACHAQDRPSHILISTGVPESVAWKALRISVGRETTRDDIDQALQELQSVFQDS